MPLPLTVPTLDDVAEPFRSEYVEQEDGTFSLQLDKPVHTDEDITNLKSALSKERDLRRGFEKKSKNVLTEEERKEFDDLRQTKEGVEKKRLESKGEYDKLIEKMTKEHEEGTTQLRSELEAEKGRTRRLYVKDKIRAAAVAAGVMKENVEDVLMLTDARFELRDDDEIVVLDLDGELSVDTPKTFFEKTFKTERPIYYEPSTGPGTGTPATGQTTGKRGVIRLTYAEASDPQKYRDAKKEAADRGVKFEVEERIFTEPGAPTTP